MSIKSKIILLAVSMLLFSSITYAFNFKSFMGGGGSKWQTLKPVNGNIELNVNDINDGQAHHYQTKAADGIMAKFFVLMSKDGVIRAAMDACDVCYKAGKGYVQDGDFMVCINCGQRFASSRINVVKGGCNPAPLERIVKDGKLLISMETINKNSWYSRYQK